MLRQICSKRITLEKDGRRAIETSGNKILTTQEDVDIFLTPKLFYTYTFISDIQYLSFGTNNFLLSFFDYSEHSWICLEYRITHHSYSQIAGGF